LVKGGFSPQQVYPTCRFGPFVRVPSDSMKPVGFDCRKCKRPVRSYGVVVPSLSPRLMFYADWLAHLSEKDSFDANDLGSIRWVIDG
jgi:hypothetical protein